MAKKNREPAAFQSNWPEGLSPEVAYQVLCDDKGCKAGSFLNVYIDQQGDVFLSMQDWENVPEGEPTPFPSIRIRTLAGGGRNRRTRQALLWLADAIRRDNEDGNQKEIAKPTPDL